MPILDEGYFLGESGWVFGHMGTGPRKLKDFGLKWMEHRPGPTNDGSWSICLNPNTATLAVLISGRFTFHFREAEGQPEIVKTLMTQGQYILFRPPMQHWSEAIETSIVLTIRWPSAENDCGSILREPWASAVNV